MTVTNMLITLVILLSILTFIAGYSIGFARAFFKGVVRGLEQATQTYQMIAHIVRRDLPADDCEACGEDHPPLPSEKPSLIDAENTIRLAPGEPIPRS